MLHPLYDRFVHHNGKLYVVDAASDDTLTLRKPGEPYGFTMLVPTDSITDVGFAGDFIPLATFKDKMKA